MFKNIFSGLLGAVLGVVATMQGVAQKWEDKWEAVRTEKFAAFDPACPYIKTNLEDYMRAWDRQYPYEAVVVMYAKNQAQYFPDIDAEKAKACFIAPVKKES